MRHQNNLSDEQGGTWRAPRSGAPTALWWDSWNMQRAATPVTHLHISAPLRYPSPINPLPHPHPKNPSCTHTHSSTGHWHQRGHGLRCKTPPACFNFHLPLHDPLQLVTQVASCCTPLLFSPLPSAPFSPSPRFALISAMLHFSQFYVVLTLHTHTNTHFVSICIKQETSEQQMLEIIIIKKPHKAVIFTSRFSTPCPLLPSHPLARLRLQICRYLLLFSVYSVSMLIWCMCTFLYLLDVVFCLCLHAIIYICFLMHPPALVYVRLLWQGVFVSQ